MSVLKHTNRLFVRGARRVGAGLVIGLIVSSVVQVVGQTRSDDGVENSSVIPAKMAKEEITTTSILPKPVDAEPHPQKPFFKNPGQWDKPDSVDYFTETTASPVFDPCTYADGRKYVGPGTVLNPHSDHTGCLPPIAALQPEDYYGGATLENASFSIGEVELAPQTSSDGFSRTTDGGAPIFSFPAIFGPTSGLGGGTSPIVSVTLTGDPDPDFTDPGGTGSGANPVPIPAPALLFLIGLGSVMATRRR